MGPPTPRHKQQLIAEMWQIIAKSQGKGGHDNITVKDLEAEADDEAAMTSGQTGRERIEANQRCEEKEEEIRRERKKK